MHDKPFSVEQIVGVTRWTPSLLSFSATRPLELDYLPGQYARIGLQGDGRLIWRAFSFVSAPHERQLEFVAVLVPDGLFTSRLQDIQSGDPIHVEHENYGFLTADRFADGEDLWMLATGTGIGPYVSMLRDATATQPFRRIILVHGVRHDAELIYRAELRQLQAARAASGTTLTLLHCVSQPDGDVMDEQRIAGRITAAWDSGMLEAKAGCPVTVESSRVMMCGNPQMIEDMRARLHARGMKPCRRMAAGQFLTENYW